MEFNLFGEFVPFLVNQENTCYVVVKIYKVTNYV